MSFLEMLDVFNEDLSSKGGQPVSFDHDCREEFAECACILMEAHGPDRERLVNCTCVCLTMEIRLRFPLQCISSGKI
jgi:hypothetical protein